MQRKGVSVNEAKKRVQQVNRAFPDALVENYDKLIKKLELPDPKDCHVLATAIKSNADVIVTNNIKDFPQKYIESFDLKVKTADDLLTDIIDLNGEQALAAFREMVLYKRKSRFGRISGFRTIEKKRIERYRQLFTHIIIKN